MGRCGGAGGAAEPGVRLGRCVFLGRAVRRGVQRWCALACCGGRIVVLASGTPIPCWHSATQMLMLAQMRLWRSRVRRAGADLERESAWQQAAKWCCKDYTGSTQCAGTGSAWRAESAGGEVVSSGGWGHGAVGAREGEDAGCLLWQRHVVRAPGGLLSGGFFCAMVLALGRVLSFLCGACGIGAVDRCRGRSLAGQSRYGPWRAGKRASGGQRAGVGRAEGSAAWWGGGAGSKADGGRGCC